MEMNIHFQSLGNRPRLIYPASAAPSDVNFLQSNETGVARFNDFRDSLGHHSSVGADAPMDVVRHHAEGTRHLPLRLLAPRSVARSFLRGLFNTRRRLNS